jgi:hypothetical protein
MTFCGLGTAHAWRVPMRGRCAELATAQGYDQRASRFCGLLVPRSACAAPSHLRRRIYQAVAIGRPPRKTRAALLNSET